jgi:hypothetical protein
MIIWTPLSERLPATDCRVILRCEHAGEIDYDLAWYEAKTPSHGDQLVGSRLGTEWRITEWSIVNAP